MVPFYLTSMPAVLNVAWDLDIRYPTEDYVGDIATDNEHLYMQYNKASNAFLV